MSNISHNDNIYKRLLPLLFKVLIFFTPLIFIMGTNEIFEFPKTYFAYFICSTIIWLFLIRKIKKGKKINLSNKYLNIFVIIYTISTLLSTDLYTSFWGYYTRFNGGLFSILMFYGIYIVLDNEFRKKDIEKLVLIGSFSLIPIGLYAILQHFSIGPLVWENDPTIRAFSTLGQPNWLAAFISMYLPFIFAKMLGMGQSEDLDKKLLTLIFVIGFSALWFTYSLSGLLGFAVGFSYLILTNLEKVKQNKKISAFVLGICLFVAVLNPGIFYDKINDIFVDFKKISNEILTVHASENNFVSDPGYIRRYLWTGTLNLITSSPRNILLGTGPETFPYEFKGFRPKELNFSSEWNLVFNKPHNYYLELAANIGVLGLAMYLLIIYKSFKTSDKIFLPGLITLYVSNAFGWPTVSTAILFFIFLLGTQKNDQ